MHRNRRVVGMSVAVFALLMACGTGPPAGPGPQEPGSPTAASGPTAVPQDPVALVGLWKVTDADEERGAVLRVAPDGLALWRACGVLRGEWRADPSGLFVGDLYSTTGCAPTDEFTPAWLTSTAAFRIEGDGPLLLDTDGNTIARLQPGGKPTPRPDVLPDYAKPPVVTDEARRNLGPAAPLPQGLAPAERRALLGRWVPASGSGGEGRAYVELRADGGWRGSDGCNAQGGRWTAGPAGAFLATSGPGTLIGCENVPVAVWLSAARRAGLDGDVLVVLDARGAEQGRFRRAG